MQCAPPSCLPAAWLHQNLSDPLFQPAAGFGSNPEKSSSALALIYVPVGTTDMEYPKSPTVPRVSYKAPLPGIVHATYVPAFGYILLSPDPNRAILAIQLRSHAILPQ